MLTYSMIQEIVLRHFRGKNSISIAEAESLAEEISRLTAQKAQAEMSAALLHPHS
jgi:hypothetical protein